MPSPARRFFLIMLAGSALFAGGPVLLNYSIDPYDRFGNNRLGVYIMAEREMKATEIARHPHTAVLLGNSRMAAIPAARLDGFHFFNGAFPAANPEEIYWFIHHHVKKQELVVLGVDLGETDPPVLGGDIFRRGDWASETEHLMNLQTVEYSFKTLFSHWAGKPRRYLANGSMTELDFGNSAKGGNASEAAERLERLKNGTMNFVLRPPRTFSYCRKIADILRERKIPCVVVLPPVHEEVIRHLGAMHMQAQWQAWTDEVRAIFPNVVDLTFSPYSAVSSFYAMDPRHYKAEVGVQFMNEEVLPLAMKVVRDRAK